MKAIKILNEVQNEIIFNCEKKVLDPSKFSHKTVNLDCVFYKFFRAVTTQNQRDSLINILDSFSIKKDRNDAYFPISDNPLVKSFGIDYVDYIYRKDPDIPETFFDDLRDKSALYDFLRSILFAAYLEHIPLKVLGKKNVAVWRKSIDERKKIVVKGNLFIYKGFSSRTPVFESLFSDYGYNIFKKKKRFVAFDLGAFIGDTAFQINKIFKPEKIFAFEPDRKNFELLKENVSLNNLQGKVIPKNLAVGKSDGSMFLKRMGGSSSVQNKKIPGLSEVKVRSLDSFVKENKIEKVDFIKMDIEGAEFDALKGAIKTIKKDRPDLYITIYHKGDHFFEIPGWLKKVAPEYNLRFIGISSASPIIERCIVASTDKI